MKVVLTGAAHAGKSTVRQWLEEKGYATVPESAEEILRENFRARRFAGDWNVWREDPANEKLFQEAVAHRHLSREVLFENFPGPVFFDRGIYDGIAYCRMRNVDLPDLLSSADGFYDVAFHFPAIDFQRRLETGRIDTPEENERISELLREVYGLRARENHVVPIFGGGNIAERVDKAGNFVLGKLGLGA